MITDEDIKAMRDADSYMVPEPEDFPTQTPLEWCGLMAGAVGQAVGYIAVDVKDFDAFQSACATVMACAAHARQAVAQ